MKYYLIIMTFLACTISYGGLIDPSNNDSQHISYADDFVYVGKIKCLNNEGSVKYHGSCVAVSDNVLITAAHVFMDKNDKYTVDINDQTLQVIKIVVHEKFDASKKGSYDIAIIFVNKDIGLKWYPSLYSKNDEANKICSLSGYGASGTFISGAVIFDGKRRAGSNYIDYVEDDVLVCSPSINVKKTQLEFLIFHGDSGGGLFIDNDLAGIHSFVSRNNKKTNEYSTTSHHTRISKHIKWIRDHTNL